jgi:1-acyl-sn-glycerol-3-phosphate acyltransferase
MSGGNEAQLGQQPDLLQRSLYASGRAVIRLYAWLMLKVDILWRAALPSGPKLIVANHPSCSDPFYLALAFSQPIHLMLVDSPFSIPLFGAYLRLSRHIPVTPGSGNAAFDAARRLLEAGQSVALFPEGHVSPQQGGFLPPRTGAARLALLTGVPVVPIGLHLPRERNLLLFSTVTGRQTVGYWYLRGPYGMTVGQALHFSGNTDDRRHVVAVSDKIMQQIVSLAFESERRATAKILSR